MTMQAMGDLAREIGATVMEIRAVGPPRRRLLIQLEVRRACTEPLVLLRSDIRVSLQDLGVASGDLLTVRLPLIGPAVLPGGGAPMIAVVEVPLGHDALAMVEARRTGDLEFAVSGELLVAPVVESGEGRLGVPEQARLEVRCGGWSREGRLPRSRWLELLGALGWDETLLIELPFSERPQLHPMALRRWQEGVEHFRAGDWDATLAACRRALEMLALEHTPEGERVRMTRIRHHFDESARGEILDRLVMQLSAFCHLGRHERPAASGVRVTRADALLALTTAGSILRYLNG